MGYGDDIQHCLECGERIGGVGYNEPVAGNTKLQTRFLLS